MNTTRLLAGVLSAAFVSAVGVAIRLIYKKFKRSGANEIESFSRYAIQGVKYYIGHFVRRQLAAQLTLRQYARLHLRSTRTQEMLVPATYPVKLKVDKVFVPLLLRGSLQEQINYSNLLDRRGQRIMVLGEPGSGKSSLFKRLFRDTCRHAASSPGHSSVPILFELRDLSKLTKTSKPITGGELFNILTLSLKQSAVYRASQAVEDLSHGAGFFVLLDGLDEVSSEQSTIVLDAIAQLSTFLAETAPKSTLLVSSRTQYFFSVRRRDIEEIFEIFTIRPFTLGDIYQFLTKWPYEANLKEEVTRIFSRLRQLPSLTEMCTNPLALSMLVARDQRAAGTELPETRSRFYDSLVDELIAHRRSRHEDMPAGTQRLRDTRREILGSVCLQHLLSSEETPNSIPAERFTQAMKKKNYGGPDAVASLVELANDTGLFDWEREGETMRFLHLTLCEFLAAVEVVEMGDAGWGDLSSLLASDTDSNSPSEETKSWGVRLSEVVAFASGLASRALREHILNDLADMSQQRLLLKAIIETQVYGEQVAVDTVKAECAEVLKASPQEWDSEWFTRLRAIVAVLRDAAVGRRSEFSSYSPSLPQSSQLLMELITRYHAEDELLSTLARQDADSAISIAEDAHRPELMNYVTAAADDFAVLQGILARYERGVKNWGAALVERALTDRNIATILNASIEDEGDDRRQPSSGGAWSNTWVFRRRSVYSILLDNVLSDTNSRTDYDGPLLTHVVSVRPPEWEMFDLMRESVVENVPGIALLAFAAFSIILTNLFGRSALNLLEQHWAFFIAPIGLLITYIALRSRRSFSRMISRSITIELAVKVAGSEIRIAAQEEPDKGERLEGSVVRINRLRVLREIFNVNDYRFRGLEGGSSAISGSTKFGASFMGILPEVRTLMAMRALRAEANRPQRKRAESGRM
jgi:hypothetical protein